MRDDDREADRRSAERAATIAYLSGQIAALWRELADVQTQIVQIHENRIKALLTAASTDSTKKLN